MFLEERSTGFTHASEQGLNLLAIAIVREHGDKAAHGLHLAFLPKKLLYWMHYVDHTNFFLQGQNIQL